MVKYTVGHLRTKESHNPLNFSFNLLIAEADASDVEAVEVGVTEED